MINKNITEKRKEIMLYILENRESYATGLSKDSTFSIDDRASITKMLNELKEINILKKSESSERKIYFDLTEIGKEIALLLREIERMKNKL